MAQRMQQPSKGIEKIAALINMKWYIVWVWFVPHIYVYACMHRKIMNQGWGVKNQCAGEKPQAIFITVNVTRVFWAECPLRRLPHAKWTKYTMTTQIRCVGLCTYIRVHVCILWVKCGKICAWLSTFHSNIFICWLHTPTHNYTHTRF